MSPVDPLKTITRVPKGSPIPPVRKPARVAGPASPPDLGTGRQERPSVAPGPATPKAAPRAATNRQARRGGASVERAEHARRTKEGMRRAAERAAEIAAKKYECSTGAGGPVASAPEIPRGSQGLPLPADGPVAMAGTTLPAPVVHSKLRPVPQAEARSLFSEIAGALRFREESPTGADRRVLSPTVGDMVQRTIVSSLRPPTAPSISTPTDLELIERESRPARLGRYAAIGAEIGKLVETKQAAYGDAFDKSGQVLAVLYPDGIQPDQVDDALAVVRVIDRLFRVATQRDALGESPWRDIAGYALLAVARIEAQQQHQQSTPNP